MAALRQAYGVDPPQAGAVDEQLALGEQFIALDPGLTLQPPVGTSLRAHAEGLADQLLATGSRSIPSSPSSSRRPTFATPLAQVTPALQQPNGRLENVEPADAQGAHQGGRTAAARHHVRGALRRRRAAPGSTWSSGAAPRPAATTLTVGQVRRWLDGADTPAERRGLTTEVADLVILVVAAATNRALLDAGQPVARARDRPPARRLGARAPGPARPGRLGRGAVARARDMGVVAASTAACRPPRWPTCAADHRRHRGRPRTQAVRDLVPALEAAAGPARRRRRSTRLSTAKAGRGARDQACGRRPDARRRGAGRRTDPDDRSRARHLDRPGSRPSPTSSSRTTGSSCCRPCRARRARGTGDAVADHCRLTEALAADELTIAARGPAPRGHDSRHRPARPGRHQPSDVKPSDVKPPDIRPPDVPPADPAERARAGARAAETRAACVCASGSGPRPTSSSRGSIDGARRCRRADAGAAPRAGRRPPQAGRASDA